MAMFFAAFAILLTAPSICFSTVCVVLAILSIDSNNVFCEMTVTHVLSKRHPDFPKYQLLIGSKCGLVIMSLVNQNPWLLLGQALSSGVSY